MQHVMRRNTGSRLVVATCLALAAAAGMAPASSAAPARPNLKVISGTSSLATVQAGGSLTTTARVKNVGRATARVSTTEFVLSADSSRDSSDTALTSSRTKPLKRSKVATLSVSLTIPAATVGTFKLLACADSKKVLKESSERDNCAVVGQSLAVTPVPDAGTGTTPPATTTPPSGSTPTGPVDSGFTIGPGPIALGNQPISATNDEILASRRIVTITNTKAIESERFFIGGYAVSPLNDGAPMTFGMNGSGPTWCDDHMTLPAGGSCDIRLSWDGPVVSGAHVGIIKIFRSYASPAEVLHSQEFSMEVASRPWFSVGPQLFNGYHGVVERKDLILTNSGNLPINTSNVLITAAAPTIGSGGYRVVVPSSTCMADNTTVGPGQTCTVRLEFCMAAAGTFVDGWQLYETNGVTQTPRSQMASLTAIFATQQDPGDVCAGYSPERIEDS